MPKGQVWCKNCWEQSRHTHKTCKNEARPRPQHVPRTVTDLPAHRRRSAATATAARATPSDGGNSQSVSIDANAVPGSYTWTDITPTEFEFMDEDDFIAEFVDKPAFRELKQRQTALRGRLPADATELSYFQLFQVSNWHSDAAFYTQEFIDDTITSNYLETAFCAYFKEQICGQDAAQAHHRLLARFALSDPEATARNDEQLEQWLDIRAFRGEHYDPILDAYTRRWSQLQLRAGARISGDDMHVGTMNKGAPLLTTNVSKATTIGVDLHTVASATTSGTVYGVRHSRPGAHARRGIRS